MFILTISKLIKFYNIQLFKELVLPAHPKEAGSLIAEKAGKYLKKAVMELGGNDPFVVLADADLELAVSEAIRGRCINAGQVCFSPKRFIIEKSLY